METLKTNTPSFAWLVFKTSIILSIVYLALTAFGYLLFTDSSISPTESLEKIMGYSALISAIILFFYAEVLLCPCRVGERILSIAIMMACVMAVYFDSVWLVSAVGGVGAVIMGWVALEDASCDWSAVSESKRFFTVVIQMMIVVAVMMSPFFLVELL